MTTTSALWLHGELRSAHLTRRVQLRTLFLQSIGLLHTLQKMCSTWRLRRQWASLSGHRHLALHDQRPGMRRDPPNKCQCSSVFPFRRPHHHHQVRVELCSKVSSKAVKIMHGDFLIFRPDRREVPIAKLLALFIIFQLWYRSKVTLWL